MTSILSPRIQLPEASSNVPPLYSGDRLRQGEFLRRYDAAPKGVKAELIGGMVYVASPLGLGHGEAHYRLVWLLGTYQFSTPGISGADNATVVLGDDSVPQPDLHLRLLPEYGGQSRPSPRGLLEGPPELVIEVAYASESIDLHAKLEDYRRAGVREYLVLLVRGGGGLRAFDLPANQDRPIDADGVYRSAVFPGLWIDPAALLSGDSRRALDVLNRGLASPEHAAFVQRLTAAAAGGE